MQRYASALFVRHCSPALLWRFGESPRHSLWSPLARHLCRKCLPWDTSLRGAGSPVLCMSATCETVTLVVLRLKAHWFRPTTALSQACRTEPNYHGPDSNQLLPGLSSRRLCHKASVAYSRAAEGGRTTARATEREVGGGRNILPSPTVTQVNGFLSPTFNPKALFFWQPKG